MVPAEDLPPSESRSKGSAQGLEREERQEVSGSTEEKDKRRAQE